MSRHNLCFPHISKRAAMLCGMALLGACLMTGCKKKHEKIDLSSISSSSAETMAENHEEESKEIESSSAESSEDAISIGQSGSGASSVQGSSSSRKVYTKQNTYTSGNVTILYPSVQNLDDTTRTAAVDELLKNNALAILDACKIDPAKDTLDIKCQVLSADRNRITVTYTGTLSRSGDSEPTHIFYSNTVDVDHCDNLTFSKFADPYTMAGYVLSGDCQFPFASDSVRADLMKAKNQKTIEEYTRMFANADFPVKETFPESFSYEHEGNIYFSIPVSRTLGDYAIVMYTPDTK